LNGEYGGFVMATIAVLRRRTHHGDSPWRPLRAAAATTWDSPSTEDSSGDGRGGPERDADLNPAT
jgi:hypothetical protein